MMKNKVQGGGGKPHQKLTDEELLQATGGSIRPPLEPECPPGGLSKAECKKHKSEGCYWNGADKECQIMRDFW